MARFTRETIRKARALATHLDVRIDAGLVEGPAMDTVDEEFVSFVGRIENNAMPDVLARPYLSRDPGRPTKEGAKFAVDLRDYYRAESWTRSYRMVLVVDLSDAKTGLRELFPRHFFPVTNWSARTRSAWELLERYRNRGSLAGVNPGVSLNNHTHKAR